MSTVVSATGLTAVLASVAILLVARRAADMRHGASGHFGPSEAPAVVDTGAAPVPANHAEPVPSPIVAPPIEAQRDAEPSRPPPATKAPAGAASAGKASAKGARPAGSASGKVPASPASKPSASASARFAPDRPGPGF
jgi:hypothetical protein